MSNADFYRLLALAVREPWGGVWCDRVLVVARDVLDALSVGDVARADDVLRDAQGLALLGLALVDYDWDYWPMGQ